MSEIVESEVVDIPLELSVFDPVAAAVEKAKEENAALVFDYEDPKGNKEARSHIYRLRQLKAPIAEIHKMAKAEALRFTNALDAKKRELIGAVDAMIEVHHAPIQAIEDREAAAKAEEERRIQEQKEKEEAARLAEIEAKERALREQEERLRKEKEEIERKEREAQIAEEARKQAAQEAKQALIDAENRRLADIAREKEAARVAAEAMEREVQRQREQEEAEKARKAAEEKARIENQEHRGKIHKEIYDALLSKVGLVPSDAQAVGVALRDRKIPHVRIEY